MHRKAGALGALLFGLLLTGCFDVEQSLVLNKDLSGTAGLDMSVSFEPMVGMMARMQRMMAGQEGDPSAEEMAKVRQEMLASMSESHPDQQAASLASSLPPGVKLLDSSFEDHGLDMKAHARFAFDDLAKLQQIRMPQPPAPAEAAAAPLPQGAGTNPFDTPFGNLQIERQGGALLLTAKPAAPLAEATGSMGEMGPAVTPEMKKQMENDLGNPRVVWKIQTPFEVLESNATRRDGDTLVWEYTLAAFEKMTPEQRAEGIRLKLKM